MAVENNCKMYLGDTLLSGGGEFIKEFCQINPIVKEYIENVTYDPGDYTVSNVGTYASQETDYEKLNSWATRIGEIRELIDEKELRWLELDEIMN